MGDTVDQAAQPDEDGDGGFGDAGDRLRSFCRLLPETVELDLLGSRSFRVATITFATYEVAADGTPLIAVKLGREDQKLLVRQHHWFEPAPDTGEHGWTNIRINDSTDWDVVDDVVVRSYRAVAPSHLLSTLEFMLRAADAAETPEEIERLAAELEESRPKSSFAFFGFDKTDSLPEEDGPTRQGLYMLEVVEEAYDGVIDALHKWLHDHPHVRSHRLFEHDR